MAKVLIVFNTRSGNTRTIADCIGEGIRSGGYEAKVVDVKKIKGEKDLQGYDGYVFGSATYHGEMMQGMKTMLFLAEKSNLEGKVGGAFGAYGWSGEASDRIYDTMKHVLKMIMVSKPLRQKSAGSMIEKKVAQDYGREVGKKITVG